MSQRINPEMLKRLIDSGASLVTVQLWRDPVVRIEDVLLDLRDARAALAEAEKERDALRERLQQWMDGKPAYPAPAGPPSGHQQ